MHTSKKILFVDLDGSLMKSDFLFESFFYFFSKNIFAPFISLGVLLQKGQLGLKRFLYENSDISISKLPYNNKVLSFIENWQEFNDGMVILISASDDRAVEKISNHLGCFNGSYGSKDLNLKSSTKLQKIKEISKNNQFDYIGNSHDDLVILKSAQNCILVNPSYLLKRKARSVSSSIDFIEGKRNRFIDILRTIRIHQWLKNGLIFIPSILAGLASMASLSILIKGFFAFSFTASAFYILNDLFDIQNDRNHHSKKERSFASGSMSIPFGFFVFVVLIFISILISSNLPLLFQIYLFIYALSTFLYSKYLKKIPLVDIFTLSYLYILRLLSGGALMSLNLSNWLLTFSVFFFLFLASIKRWIEINRMDSKIAPGRGYTSSDKNFTSQLSYTSGVVSVLVICLYIESQQAQELYSASQFLWFMPIILLYWVVEILFKVERHEVDDDPVIYALKTKTSYFLVFCFIAILWIESTL